MALNNRIKLLRNDLGLKQEEFGKQINLTKFAISNYENGRTGIPDRVISDICREFNVNEKWLRTGEGEMLVQLPPEDETAALVFNLMNEEENPFYSLILETVRTYDQLDGKSKEVLKLFGLKLLENIHKKKEND